MWQRFKKNRYSGATDGLSINRNTNGNINNENGNVELEPLSPSVTEIEHMPLKYVRKSSKENAVRNELDPLSLDDENDPDSKNDDKSVDKL